MDRLALLEKTLDTIEIILETANVGEKITPDEALQDIWGLLLQAKAKAALADPAPQEPEKPHPHAVQHNGEWYRWGPVKESFIEVLWHWDPNGIDGWAPITNPSRIEKIPVDLYTRCQAAAREASDA